jgi:hypothetical protein
MSLSIPVVETIGGLFKNLFGLIDDLHTSDEEKLTLKSTMFMAQGELLGKVFEYESSILKMQSDIIIAEAKGESWLQRSWRPIAMLSLLGLVGAYWFGFTPTNLDKDAVNGLFLLVQIGLGGYVVGRSAEKVAGAINFNKATD